MNKEEAKEELKEIQQLLLQAQTLGLDKAIKRLTLWENKLILHINTN